MVQSTHNSAKHSINNLDPGVDVIVEEVDATLSNSDRTATITAEISYISLGHSLIVCSSV